MPFVKSEKRGKLTQKSSIKKPRKRKSTRQLLAELYPVPNYDLPGQRSVFRDLIKDDVSKKDTIKCVKREQKRGKCFRSREESVSCSDEAKKTIITEDDDFSLTCYRENQTSTKESSVQTNTTKKRRGCLSWVTDLQSCVLADLINYASNFQGKDFNKVCDQNRNDCCLKYLPVENNQNYDIAWGITNGKSEVNDASSTTVVDEKPLVQEVRSIGTVTPMSKPLLLEAGAQTPSSFAPPISCEKPDCPARTFATQTNASTSTNGTKHKSCTKTTCPLRSSATQTLPMTTEGPRPQMQSIPSPKSWDQTPQGHGPRGPNGWNHNAPTHGKNGYFPQTQSWPQNGMSEGQNTRGINNEVSQQTRPQQMQANHSWTQNVQARGNNQSMPQQASWNNGRPPGQCTCCSCYGQPYQQNKFCASHNIPGGNVKCDPENWGGPSNRSPQYNRNNFDPSPKNLMYGYPEPVNEQMRQTNVCYERNYPPGESMKARPPEEKEFLDTGTRGVQTSAQPLCARGEPDRRWSFENSRGIRDVRNPSFPDDQYQNRPPLTIPNQQTSPTQVSDTPRQHSGSSDSYDEREREMMRLFDSLGVSESARESIMSTFSEIDREEIVRKTLQGLSVSEQNSILSELAEIEKETVRDTILETVSESVRNSLLSTLSEIDKEHIRATVLEGVSESVRNSILSTLSQIDKENIRDSILEVVSESARNSILSSLSELEKEATLDKAMEGLSESARGSILSALSEVDKEELLANVMDGLSDSVRNSIEKSFADIDREEILAKALEGLSDSARNSILGALAESESLNDETVDQSVQTQSLQKPPDWEDCAGGQTDCCLSNSNYLDESENEEGNDYKEQEQENFNAQFDDKPIDGDTKSSEDKRHQEQLEGASPVPSNEPDKDKESKLNIDPYPVSLVAVLTSGRPQPKESGYKTQQNKMWINKMTKRNGGKKTSGPPNENTKKHIRPETRQSETSRTTNKRRDPYPQKNLWEDPECRKRSRKGEPLKIVRSRGYEACAQKRCNEKDAECRRGLTEYKRCPIVRGTANGNVLGRHITTGTQIDMM